MRTSLVDLFRALRLRRPVEEPEPGSDPFDTLAIQYRLSRVAAEIHTLENTRRCWARGFHLVAATTAYDGLLCDAARMAGVPIPDTEPRVRTLMLEAELRRLGWHW
ncbi:hypothetical protein EF847_00700 [Actinobacteria bacterium YIM 96077]|uniref:Uncharacterized protein n=1 Tax=Phytoactinopolyspora halophila TaxID=1981511 RepID=A0A329R4L6_9ACTN|nr:hypothetical protein [Phytoactinopolyspora halophila]AYY11460.1 hypothetical protein EF847_00700 [Actinobacteria bacterium YIM 96077]RAW18058.1 hypothetical protein DPM12_04305 [Phytoactinopolyspora halophila]